MTDELKRIYTYNGGVTAVLKTPLVITDTTAFYRIGQSPRVWIGSSFKVFSDASGTTQYVLGVDYVLDQHYVDIDISKQVGEACYSYLKFVKEARTIYVDMDVVGSHVDGSIINELIENGEVLADKIDDIEADITAINNKNNEQDLRLSAAETVNNAQNVTLDDHEARLDNLSNVTNDAQLKRAAGDINSFDNKAAIANGDLFLIEDSEDGYSKKKVSASQITSIGGGGGDVFGPASSVSDDIALFDGVTGKLLKDSGRKLNTGAVAGTVPVRDSNGKLPGDITGDAAKIGGVGLSQIPYLGQTPTTNKLGSAFTGDADNIVAEGIYINNNNSITNIPSGTAYGWLIHHQWSTSAAAHQTYIRQSSVKTMFRRMKVGDVWQSWVQISDDVGNPVYQTFASAPRGFKNTLYVVNWTINIPQNTAFRIYQPVWGQFSSPGARVMTNGSYQTIPNVITCLNPGEYAGSTGGALSLYISFAPSQTQSDIITVG